jgi:hypothetical protein
MSAERDEQERQAFDAFRYAFRDGVFANVLTVHDTELGLHREGERTWAYVLFRVRERPGCTFARGWLIRGPGAKADLDDAVSFMLGLMEELDAQGWGVPVDCEPGVVTWLDDYAQAPWEPPPSAEPVREAFEGGFLDRLGELSGSVEGVTVERIALHRQGAWTFASITFSAAQRPGCTFAKGHLIWPGYPTAATAEDVAASFHAAWLRVLELLPADCQPGRVTWPSEQYGPPHWAAATPQP